MERALQIQETAEAMMEGREFDIPSAQVPALVEEGGCSAYDAEFVSLARQLGLPLVTEDQRLLAAFPGSCVSVAQMLERGAGS